MEPIYMYGNNCIKLQFSSREILEKALATPNGTIFVRRLQKTVTCKPTIKLCFVLYFFKKHQKALGKVYCYICCFKNFKKLAFSLEI